MKKKMEPADSDSAASHVPTSQATGINVAKKRGHPVGQSDNLTSEEVQLMLSLPDKRKRDELRDYTVLLIFSNTPIRKSELASLNVSNLVDEGKKQFITYAGLKKRSKTKRHWLNIPLARDVYEAVVRYVKTEYKGQKIEHDAPLFFTLGKHGPYKKGRITVRAIDKIVAKYKRKAKITKRITPHSFRATYVTDRASIDPGTMIGLTGHENIKGLSPYLRSSQEKREEAALSRHYT